MGLTRQERYDKEKSKNKLKSDSATTTFMPQEAMGQDVLSQPAVVKTVWNKEGTEWTCPKCGEKNREGEEECANCGEAQASKPIGQKSTDEEKEDKMTKETRKEEKKPTDEEGKLIKAPEKPEEEETKKSEDLSDETDDKEETEEEKKKKKAKKGQEGGENPEEAGASSNDGNSSTSPGMGVPSAQNVFVPQSNINVGGTSTGQSPSETHYSGKSANTDLMKSPLFVNINKQLDEMRKSYEKKLTAMEKSMTDRLANITKTLKNVEEFYNKPLYKGFAENTNPEAVQRKTISKQLEDGKVRFSSQ